MTSANHADKLWTEFRFWSQLANDYLNTASPDPEYLAKVLATAAERQEAWEGYLAHIRATNTSHHLAA